MTQMGTGYFWDMLSMSQKYPVPIWVTVPTVSRLCASDAAWNFL